MSQNNILPEALRESIEQKLRLYSSCTVADARPRDLFTACSMVMRDCLAARLEAEKEGAAGTQSACPSVTPAKQVHYMSLEFLIGRSFRNNAYNLQLLDSMKEALASMGFSLEDLMEEEPDAGLGNGGLGRLAACYLDAMAALGIDATGYTIRYEHGLFKQVIVEGQQIELPESWLDVGGVWLMPRMNEVRTVMFGGEVEENWEYGRMKPSLKNATPVLAVPYDMLIGGYGNGNVCTLRLWSAKSPVDLDMKAFSRGRYLEAMEQHAMAEVISKILYPDDNHIEGKALRLKQQYFFVSATVQDIVAKHKAKHGTLANLAQYHVIQLNDTHPAMVIPELMRILMDEENFSWEDAWEITTHTVAYTNHTVLPEALEQWPASLFIQFMPRIWSILNEINRRYCAQLWDRLGNFEQISRMAIIADDRVRMANLCVIGSFRVNGVSALHSQILRDTVFSDYARMEPEKFINVTNGIAHRRWLCEVNPGLTDLLCSCIGPDFIVDPSRLTDFAPFADDASVRAGLAKVKAANKRALSDLILQTNGIRVDPDSLFDVQVKRLHEYKRQFLNILRVLDEYLAIKADPNGRFQPRTFLFGAKAFPGYTVAKEIIRLINSVSVFLEKDPQVSPLLKVVFMENYRVTMAERIIPAAELSEQISTAGKEASGTSNMKFMMNGALTIGTMDGANVEMYQAVGDADPSRGSDANMFIFGLRADEVTALKPYYDPASVYASNGRIRAVLDLIDRGFGDGVDYHDLVQTLLVGRQPDTFMLLADFPAYVDAQRRVDAAYADPSLWNRMSAVNIAASGRFSADRSIADYARLVWHK